ncbi:unnamed protein product [Scytosiphon promiscuus]
MRRERHRKTGSHYFDLDVLSNVDEEGSAFSSFIDRYGTFVFKRAEGYDADFEELEKVDHEDGWEYAVTAFQKAQEMIDLGLACQPGRREENEMTVLCLRETAINIRKVQGLDEPHGRPVEGLATTARETRHRQDQKGDR